MTKTKILLLAYLGWVNFTVNAQTQKQILNPISLSPYLESQLSFDRPLSDFAFDSKEGHLWILGSTSLWQWNLAEDKLSRVQILAEKKHEKLEKLHIDQQGRIWVGSTHSLYQLAINDRKIKSYKSPDSKNNTIRLQTDSRGELFWTKEDGVYILSESSSQEQQLKLILSFHSFKNNNHDIRYISSNRRWLATKFEVFSLPDHDPSLKPLAVEPRLLYRSPHEIKDIMSEHNRGVSILSQHTLVRVDQWGEIKQIIPVRGQRSLRFTTRHTEAHRYLFSDGLLEEYNLINQKKQSFFIDPSIAETSTQVMSANNLLAMLTDKRPLLFFLDRP